MIDICTTGFAATRIFNAKLNCTTYLYAI
uniref:Uncharacterized protein n=1 Tax=Anguilla anguilla TaxID=7936 RepID=A0A0E9S150_ANGAN